MTPPPVAPDTPTSQCSLAVEMQEDLQSEAKMEEFPRNVGSEYDNEGMISTRDDPEVNGNEEVCVGDEKNGISEEKERELGLEPRSPEDESKAASEQNQMIGQLSVPAVMKTSFRRLAWRLYLALLLSRFIPTIYRTTRVFYLGDLPDDGGVNIASQLSWVDVILEVVQEALILPLYYMIGVTLQDARETQNRVKTGMLFTLVVHVLFAAVIVAAAEPLVKFMAQEEELFDETVIYIRLEMAAIPFNSLIQFATVVFTLCQWQFHLYMLLAMRLVLSILLDTFFLSSFDFSLQLGVNGIAYANIITNTVICSYCVVVLLVKYPKSWIRAKMSFSWMKRWGTIGFYSGLDSFVRNLFYILCIARMMNVIGEQGTYWRANEFIWNWLLLAFLPLADVLKQDTGASTALVINHKLKTTAYVVLTSVMGLAWCASVPGWKPFIETVMNVPEDDVDGVFELIMMLMPSYILFMYNSLLHSVFVGKGKTVFVAIQSVITNISVYGVSFVLYLTDVYEPSLVNISIIYTCNRIVDGTVSAVLYIIYLKKVDYKL